MEDLIKALGGEPVYYAYKNECCGGYIALEDAESAMKKSQKISGNAKNQGADVIVTACPLCMYNLKKHSKDIPVIYFTELLAKAFGIKE
jgi:heterodisulfide reductase subunit B